MRDRLPDQPSSIQNGTQSYVERLEPRVGMEAGREGVRECGQVGKLGREDVWNPVKNAQRVGRMKDECRFFFCCWLCLCCLGLVGCLFGW